jgi:hypothetical protein
MKAQDKAKRYEGPRPVQAVEVAPADQLDLSRPSQIGYDLHMVLKGPGGYYSSGQGRIRLTTGAWQGPGLYALVQAKEKLRGKQAVADELLGVPDPNAAAEGKAEDDDWPWALERPRLYHGIQDYGPFGGDELELTELPVDIRREGASVARFPAGLVVIVGASGSGKSVLSELLAADEVGEPTRRSMAYGLGPLVIAIQSAVRRAQSSRRGFAAVDSMRTLVDLAVDAAPGKGGISRSLGAYLTVIDSYARWNGVLLFSTLNLMTADEAALKAARELIDGSAQGTIHTHGVNEKRDDGTTALVIESFTTLRPHMRSQKQSPIRKK